jgi:tetratricopeptide (TPR) repeat protein
MVALGVLTLPAGGRAAPADYDSGGTGESEAHLKDARRAAYHGRYSEAIAEDTKAIALAPNFGIAYYNRAGHYTDAGRYDEALADIARVSAMHPDAILTALERIRIALRRADGAGAIAELDRAAKMPTSSFWHQPVEAGHNETGTGFHAVTTSYIVSELYAYRSIAEQLLHQDNASLTDMANMMTNETVSPWYILSNHCYTAAVAGLLETAELTCQEAIEGKAHDIGQYDSLGFVHLRMKAWAKAVADYNQALYYRSDLTLSLYGRGVAKRALGDVAGGNTDIAAATHDEPDIANIMKRLGAPAA